MKYLITWTESHSAVVEAENKYDADVGVFGRFDADTTFDDHEVTDIIGEDEDGGDHIQLTVESYAGMKRHYAPQLYEACKEFVRKVECGEARSKVSYGQMKKIMNLVERTSS